MHLDHPRSDHGWHVLRLLVGAAGAAVALAACGSTSSGRGPGPSGSTASSNERSSPGVTIGAADVAGLGEVLVNGDGRTFYVLSSEKGGRITCTDENGCTKVWPDTELPEGVTAARPGSGIQPSLLGSVRAGGSLYVTYGGWPLYTYSGDSGPRQANGEGITSFGGTWYALNPSGSPVTTRSPSGGHPTTTGAGSGY